jgi:spore germination protein GerM
VLQNLTIENGIARADFNSALNVGGSCRVTAISSQIKQTLLQFDTVNQVIISINGRTDNVLQP